VHRLKIAVFERPPYSFKDKDGNWTGLSIELWEQIAGRLGIPYDFVEMPLPEIYSQLHSGFCDLSPVIAISGEKTDQVEFTEPYLFSHGAVVMLRKSLMDSVSFFYSHIWNREVMLILLSMLAGMAVFSLLLVVVERKHEKGHFGGPPMKGIGSALWFSAVTMTTVGYGDKTPLSATGRIITFFWMLVGVLLIALFTGTVASSITMEQIQHGIVHVDDLSHFQVGCFEGSRMDSLLRSRGIPAIRYSTPQVGFEGFAKKEITAYAGDSISLDYLMTHNASGKCQIFIIPDAAMIYAFATRPNLPELSAINKELLKITLAPDWRMKEEKWTGPLSF
jgi:ABC-type amino acid transport substrate-binding protein